MPTYYDYRKVYLDQEESQNLVIALIVVSFFVMAINISSPEIIFLVALSILMLTEVLSITDVLSGFANDSLITIGTLFLVIGAMEKSHYVDYISRVAFGRNSTPFMGTVRMYVSSFLISAIVNNIPQVAIMVPVIRDWAVLKNIPASQLMIPLSYVVLAGGTAKTLALHEAISSLATGICFRLCRYVGNHRYFHELADPRSLVFKWTSAVQLLRSCRHWSACWLPYHRLYADRRSLSAPLA
jgi:hypothetical protein